MFELKQKQEVLHSLLSLHGVAQHFGVTDAMIKIRASWLRDMGVPVGWQIQGTRAWLFLPEDLELLRPEPRGRTKKEISAP